MKKLMVLLLIVGLEACKIEATIQPNIKLNESNISSENMESINIQANAIASSMVVILKNDTIRNALYIECGKGVEEYFWIGFEEFQKRLLEQWNINFESRINSTISNQNGLPRNSNYLKVFLENARSNGFSPHISIPNLQKLTNRELNEDRVLELNVADVSDLKIFSVATYLNYEDEGTGFNSLTMKDKTIVSKFIPFDLFCEELIVVVAYRIVNPNTVSPCANGQGVKMVYNCIVNTPNCKICNDYNTNIQNAALGTIGNAEQILKLSDDRGGDYFIEKCYKEYNDVTNNLNELYPKSYGVLSSFSQYYYYEPSISPPKVINGYSYYDGNLNIRKYPILQINYNVTPPIYELANKVSLCRKQNNYYIAGD